MCASATTPHVNITSTQVQARTNRYAPPNASSAAAAAAGGSTASLSHTGAAEEDDQAAWSREEQQVRLAWLSSRIVLSRADQEALRTALLFWVGLPAASRFRLCPCLDG